MAQKRQFNELSHCEIAVWCKLEPGIDPAQWASLCRFLGRLNPVAFKAISRGLSGTRLLTGARRLVGDLLDMPEQTADNPPLVSLGPSGVGGEFQREFQHSFARRTPSSTKP